MPHRSREKAPSVAASQRDPIKARCTRALSYHHPHRSAPHSIFAELAASTPPDLRPDAYGEGEVLSSLEREVAELLGKEAAVFMPSGTMAQQIALRIFAERTGRRNVAFHPTSHLEMHENKAYEILHGLHGIHCGSPHARLTLDDLSRIKEPLAAILLELPQREIGGQLPAWDELCATSAWARERAIPLHMDGARLWETKPFYKREYAEITALFDTVYVSFYKSLGGIAGAALAGPADVIGEARVWRRRHGGTLVQLFPYAISARAVLAERLDKMDAYCEKAVDTARHLAAIEGIEIVPDPPQTNMMHVHIKGDKERLSAAALDIAGETGVWLFNNLYPTSLSTRWMFELVVGDATLDLRGDEITSLFRSLLERAREPRD